ncbi:MAG TPA: hypothetical protein VGV35_12420 [Bryobacteraceae bacterium]|nr:hypothetical protein [Bryobacteraceae bacterium]
MTVFFSILLLMASVMTAAVGGMVFDFHKSDTAGQGLSRTYAAFASVFLWLLLCGVVILCGARGGFPGATVLLVIILYVGAAVAHFTALSIVGGLETGDPYESLLRLVVVAGPFVMILYCAWNFFPTLHSMIPPIVVNVLGGLLIALLAATPWLVKGPSNALTAARKDARLKAYQDEQARQKALIASIENLPLDTPLGNFLFYTDVPLRQGSASRQAAIARMKLLPRRHRDAEELLEKLDTRLLRELQDLELEMTPALCQGGRKCARKWLEQIKPSNPAPSFESIEDSLTSYSLGIQWLLKNGCDCKEEIAMFEQTVRQYPESSPRTWFIDNLRRLQAKPEMP